MPNLFFRYNINENRLTACQRRVSFVILERSQLISRNFQKAFSWNKYIYIIERQQWEKKIRKNRGGKKDEEKKNTKTEDNNATHCAS